MAAASNQKTVCATTVKGFSSFTTQGFPSGMSAEAMAKSTGKAAEMMRENAAVLRGTGSLRIWPVAAPAKES